MEPEAAVGIALSDDQRMIGEAAATFLARVSDSAAVRAAIEQGPDERVWSKIGGELGWCSIPLPERFGGLGLGAVEMVILCEQAGRYLLCAPYFATVCLAANLLMHVGTAAAQERFLPLVARGAIRASLTMGSQPGDWPDPAPSVQARRAAGDWVLDGHVARMPDAETADWLFLFAEIEDSGEVGAFAAPRKADGVAILPLRGWDATRRFARIELAAVRLAGTGRIDEVGAGSRGYARSTALARLYLAAEQLGGAQACLDLTLAHTTSRQQFGRVIASFQAVKHRCAEMMVRIEALRSAVLGVAALSADDAAADELALECAMVRSLAAETYFFCAQEAIQLHGGVGFTWDYDPQLHFKRAQAGSHWLGGADALRERIAQAVLA